MPPAHFIALVEPFWTGHPETQLKIFTETLLQQEENHVLILCQHPEVFQSWIRSAHPDKINRCFTAPFAFCTLRGDYPTPHLATWALAHQTLLNAEKTGGFVIEKIFITWLDAFICHEPDQAAALMPRPWVGLYLFPSYLRSLPLLPRFFPPKQMARDQAFLKIPYCRGVAVLDEGVKKKLSRLIPKAGVHVLPDVADTSLPVKSPDLSDAILEKAAGRPIVALLGVLGRRKGTLTFLKAMQGIDPATCFFLIAGRLEREERKTYGRDPAELDNSLAATGSRENVFLHLKHIETEEIFNSLVSICSVLYLAYEGHHHSSGILGKAAHFNKLVIVPDKGCMTERVKEFRLGITIPAGSVPHTATAIRKLCHPASHSHYYTKARFDGYRSRHNRNILKESLNNLLNEIQ